MIGNDSHLWILCVIIPVMSEISNRIRDYHAAGVSIVEIANQCECSIYLVRKELSGKKKKKTGSKGGATLRPNAARRRVSRGVAGKNTGGVAEKVGKKGKKTKSARNSTLAKKVGKKGKKGKATKPARNSTIAKKEAFLRAYSEDPNVRIACRAAGVTRTTYYRWIEKDKEFTESKNHAGEEAADLMLEICDRRIKDGQKRRITHRGDPVMVPKLDSNDQIITDGDGSKIMVPLIEIEYSDHLLMARLRSLHPELFVERTEAKVDNTHSMDGETRKAIGAMTHAERVARLTELQENAIKVNQAGGNGGGVT